jgi:hypothetical protein
MKATRCTFMGLALWALAAAPAGAREGFSLQLGLGGGFFDLNSGALDSALTKIGRAGERRLLSDPLGDGLAVRFALAYNIKGYASLELGMTGHGYNLDDSGALGGSGHVSLVAHLHPFQFVWPERDWDASVFLGGGWSILGGGQPGSQNDRGLDGGALECGLTGRYFLTRWFSQGAEIRFSVPFWDRWHVDWEDGEEYDLPGSPSSFFTAVLLSIGFHFVPG